ncbi:MAG: hypothetical protein PHC43_00500 [Candidatus Marinimicrobia bacterium]|nr:hypothetical protein [Candidatus Neomarinimicrobiota bacterium]
MDVKLDGLIEKIKQEGIAEAQRSADEIIKKAEAEAQEILEKARRTASQVETEGQQNADKLRANAEAAIRQAARDTILVTKENLQKLFDRVFKKEIAKTLSPEFIKEIILAMVKSSASNTKLEFVVSEKDVKKLEALVLAATRESLKEPVTFRVDRGIAQGFRVSRKGEEVYYDFTDQSIAEVLQEFLNPALRSLLDQNG